MNKTLSITAANILYLVTMLLVLAAGSMLQLLNFSWGLVGTEVLLILLPTLLFLRARQIPLRKGLRLRPIGWGLAALCVLLGVGTWFYAAYIDGLMMQVFGLPPVSIPADALPSSLLDSLAYFAALSIFAPVCEEALFRGAVQSTYERRRSPIVAITITSLMFAFYHFRLTGLPALLPIAFTLGYIGWRTQSLYTAILVHFGNNTISVVLSLLALNNPDFKMSITNPLIALAGLAAALGLLYAITRLTPAPGAEPEMDALKADTTAQDARPSWLRLYWPLAAAGVLFAAVSGITLAVMLNPSLTAARGVTFNTPGWTEPVAYRYAITNRAGEEVGEARCQITPGDRRVLLDCASSIQGYEIQTGQSFFSEVTHSLTWHAEWDSESLALVDFNLDRFDEAGNITLTAILEGSQLSITGLAEGPLMENLGSQPMLAHEWPWRAMFLDAQPGSSSQVSFGYLLTWVEEEQRSRPQLRQDLLRVLPLDPVSVPAGRYDAWKVTIGSDKAAWYSSGEIPALVRYDDGMSIYSLVE